ncbi:MAG: metal-sensing transcriptional repressor [Clostridia bacterium]|nr:metal-sensing transcriptional repressor [Clostridia bacterium]
MKEKYCCCCEEKKNTARTQKQIKSIESRINRINGQLAGINKMVKENRYCADILIQLSAVSSAVKGLASIILEDHLKSCVTEKVLEGDNAVMDEVLQLFKRFN